MLLPYLCLLGLILLFLFSFALIHFSSQDHGFQPTVFSRKREIMDHIPLKNQEGELSREFCITIGGYERIPGISQWGISRLMISQRLYLSTHRCDQITIRDDCGGFIGHLPVNTPNFSDILLRLQQKRQVDARVLDIDRDRGRLFCDLQIIVYDKADDYTATTVYPPYHCLMCKKGMWLEKTPQICSDCLKRCSNDPAIAKRAKKLSDI